MFPLIPHISWGYDICSCTVEYNENTTPLLYLAYCCHRCPTEIDSCGDSHLRWGPTEDPQDYPNNAQTGTRGLSFRPVIRKGVPTAITTPNLQRHFPVVFEDGYPYGYVDSINVHQHNFCLEGMSVNFTQFFSELHFETIEICHS